VARRSSRSLLLPPPCEKSRHPRDGQGRPTRVREFDGIPVRARGLADRRGREGSSLLRGRVSDCSRPRRARTTSARAHRSIALRTPVLARRRAACPTSSCRRSGWLVSSARTANARDPRSAARQPAALAASDGLGPRRRRERFDLRRTTDAYIALVYASSSPLGGRGVKLSVSSLRSQGQSLAKRSSRARLRAANTELIVMDGGSPGQSVESAYLRETSHALGKRARPEVRRAQSRLSALHRRHHGVALRRRLLLPRLRRRSSTGFRAHPEESWIYARRARRRHRPAGRDGQGGPARRRQLPNPGAADSAGRALAPAALRKTGGRVTNTMHYTMDWSSCSDFAQHAKLIIARAVTAVPITPARRRPRSRDERSPRTPATARSSASAALRRAVCYNTSLSLATSCNWRERLPARPQWLHASDSFLFTSRSAPRASCFGDRIPTLYICL